MKKLYIVGLGPGGIENITPRSQSALLESEVIAGYEVYINLIRDHFPGKNFLSTPMRQESKRCRLALEQAVAGTTISMVCSGDAGVYGMAGLIYELAQQFDPIEIEVIPGITAACSGAAVLGAPLVHDFAAISLSDLLTPWELIERRLDAAGAADFCISIYNPSSKKRKDHLKKACQILLRHRSPDTVAGIVRNIGRDDETSQITTLLELQDMQTDMFTTVFIGNSQTKNINGKMVTPRGYRGV